MRKLLERVTPERMGVSSRAIADMVRELENSGAQMHGLMVSRWDKVLFETWWAPYGPGIPHSNQSLGKTYMGAAIGLCYTDGLLSLDERVVDLFAEEIERAGLNPDENMRLMTVRDLLCMATGMEKCPPLGGEDFVLNFLKAPVLYRPGTHFMYNTSGSSLLAAIAVKKTGMPLREYMAKRLFEPIGIDEANMKWLLFANGIHAEPGVITTTEDNLRLAMLYMNGGRADGRQVIAEDWIRMATSLQNPSAEDPGIPDCKAGYGYMLWQCTVPGVFRFDGGLGQYCIVKPADGLIVAIHETANYPDGVQRTLDIVYKHLMKKHWPDALEPDDCAALELSAIGRSRRLCAAAVDGTAWKDLAGTWRATDGVIDPWMVMFREFRKDDAALSALRGVTFAWEDDRLTMDMGHGVCFAFGFDGDARVCKTTNIVPEFDLAYGYALAADGERLALRAGWLQSCFYMTFTLTRCEDGLTLLCEKPLMQSAGDCERFSVHLERER